MWYCLSKIDDLDLQTHPYSKRLWPYVKGFAEEYTVYHMCILSYVYDGSHILQFPALSNIFVNHPTPVPSWVI